MKLSFIKLYVYMYVLLLTEKCKNQTLAIYSNKQLVF